MGGEMTVVSIPGVGSVFRLRLFLPEVHGQLGAASVSGAHACDVLRPKPLGYAGPRHSVLVVDNEEADRDLLVELLTPLGFELRTAASGHDCLDLLAAGFRPSVIFMDLAMPGIDGWESLRRIRAGGHSGMQLAVVSANAFDKTLDNDVGIPCDDFILKPIRHTELLDWLEKRLGLCWLHNTTATQKETQSLPMPPRVWPPSGQLKDLLALVQLGFYRGILNKLAEIETQQPDTHAFVADMRATARLFQFEAMDQILTTQLATEKNSP